MTVPSLQWTRRHGLFTVNWDISFRKQAVPDFCRWGDDGISCRRNTISGGNKVGLEPGEHATAIAASGDLPADDCRGGIRPVLSRKTMHGASPLLSSRYHTSHLDQPFYTVHDGGGVIPTARRGGWLD